MRFKVVFLAAALAAAGAVAPAFAGPQDLKTIGDQCAAQGRAAPVCACMVQKAAKELNGNQQAFMAAQMTGNAAEIARIQSTITAQEAAATATFMGGVVGQCGG
jgi:hypothetical protein